MVSLDFKQNVDTLIDDLIFSATANPRNTNEIVQRGKRDRELILDILKRLKVFDDYSIQSDWNQVDTSAPDYIKNKPGPSVESDPIFTGSPAYNITNTDINNWNDAFSWGDHSLAGYLTSFTETDPVFSSSPVASIVLSDITNWNTAYGWGNHATAGYLTSFIETDPIYTASSWYTTTNNSSNWNTAYGWGNHAIAGYITGTGASGKVAFWTGTGILSNNTNLHWDNVNGRLGVGTSTPSSLLHVNGALTALSATLGYNSTFGNSVTLGVQGVNASSISLTNFNNYLGTGNYTWVSISGGQFAPTSGSGQHAALGIIQTINQTGTANGQVSGINISPTLTSLNASIFYRGLNLNIPGTNHYGIYQSGINSRNYFQGSIGINTTAPDNSSIVDITSTTKGFLLPRMLSTERLAIASPATSLLVYQTNSTENLYIKKSTAWKRILTEDDTLGGSETDPVFTASAAFGITSTNITNWNTVYSWGNHATAGYLTSFTELDPVFSASAASGITSTDITNWNTAFGWGNHASAGYLTSFTETDPTVAAHIKAITNTQITNWDTAYSWGNHASAGYLSTATAATTYVSLTGSYSNPSWIVDIDFTKITGVPAYLLVESDPIFSTSAAFGILGTDITNWNTAYSWGNHATAGYLSGIGGSNTQVQYNNGGSLAGAANVEIENDVLRLENVSSTANPAAGGLKIYSKNVLGGFNILVCKTPDGYEIPLQPSLFLGKMPVWVGYASGTTAPPVMGATVATAATMSTAAPVTTNDWLKHQRKTYTTSTTAGNASGIRQSYTQFSNSVGGFLAYFKFGQTIVLNGEQKFVGMCSSTGALAGDASALVHMIGMGVDAADVGGNWYLMHNDGAGIATKIDLGANAARNTTDGYELIIYIANNSSDYYVYIRNIATNTVVYNGVVNTNIPGSTNQMAWKVECRNGAVAAATNLHVATIYIQPL